MSTTHDLPAWMAWHGRLMVLSWVLLLPLGILIARFFKVLPTQRWPEELDNRAWWRAHLTLQYSGIAAMTGALLLACLNDGPMSPAATAHRVLGWIVVACGWLQIAGGLLRGTKGGPTAASLRGDHYDMSPRRLLFERIHKTGGYLAMGVSVASVVFGLRLAAAPGWMFTTLVAAWVFWIASFVLLQRRSRGINTYQAIWGPGSQHPGNRPLDTRR